MKRAIRICAAATLSASACLGSGASGANEPVTASSEPVRTMSYVRLYSDDRGESHFRDEQLKFQPLDAPHAPSLWLHELPGASRATLLMLPAGATEDWHKAPRRQYVLVLKGTSEVLASDGETRRFPPGSVMLMDDTTGKGHITRSVGSEDHVVVMIPVTP